LVTTPESVACPVSGVPKSAEMCAPQYRPTTLVAGRNPSFEAVNDCEYGALLVSRNPDHVNRPLASVSTYSGVPVFWTTASWSGAPVDALSTRPVTVA